MAEKALKEKPVNKITRTFNVDDLAIYASHGVGRIESIESREINGLTMNFYIMKILENSMVIMIPTSNVVSVGLRNLIEVDEIPKVYEIMRNKERDKNCDSQTWNRRYRDYMDKIKTGSLFDVAEVFRDLFLLKLTKDLSFGERKLLDTAQGLLIKELSTAKGIDEGSIMTEIEAMFYNS